MIFPLNLATIAIAAGAAIGGMGVGWVGREAVFNNFERPLIIRAVEQKERDACTIRTMDAAKTAEAAERQRQIAANRAAIDAFQQASEVREQALAAVQDKLDTEIADDEAQLVARGRSCLLDGDDIVSLRGNAG